MTDRPADFGAQRAAATRRLADLPSETLITGALDTLSALAVQHRAWLDQLEVDREDALACGCEGCRELISLSADTAVAFGRDLLRIENAADALIEVRAYEKPDPDALETQLQSFAEHAAQEDRRHNPAIQQLNALLKVQPCAAEKPAEQPQQPPNRKPVFDTATTRLDLFAARLGVAESRTQDTDLTIDDVIEELSLQSHGSVCSRAAEFAAASEMLRTYGHLPFDDGDPARPSQLTEDDHHAAVLAKAAEAYPVRDDVDVRAVLRKDYPYMDDATVERIDAKAVKLLGFVPTLCTAGSVEDLALLQEIIRADRLS